MKLRTLIIVAVALAVVTLAGYKIRNASLTTPEDDPLIGTKLMDQKILADVKRVEISKEDSTVVLRQEGSGWVVDTLYNLPADFSKLNTLIRDLVDATIERKITAREDRLERLDLNQGTVKLMSGPDKALFEITFGKTLTGGKAFVFGREKTAYMSSESPYIDASSNNWAVKTLYEFKAEDVAGIQFNLKDETWAVRRDDKDSDFVSTLPVDVRTPKQSAITSLISRFTNLRFTEVSERSTTEATDTWEKAQDNSRSIKFTLFSGETVTVKMSQWEPPKPEGEDAPASTEPSVTYLNISSSQADRPINALMGRLAFQASSYTFSGIPVEITEVADLPKPDATPAEENPTGTTGTNSNQPEVKQHIDGNSVIFEVTPPKKDGEEETEPATPNN